MKHPIPTTEDLLCSPLGFDLTTATPVQRARCRIGDGIPLGNLKNAPDVIAMVGGPEAVEALPSERGIAPRMVVDVSSIRSAKTMMACCRAARAIFAIKAEALRIGEVIRIPLFSLKLARSRVAFRMLVALFSRPALKPLLLGPPTADTLMVLHPSRVSIEIVCCAGGRAAQDFVGDWLGGFIADEATRMLGRGEGVTNLTDALSTVQGRVLDGGQIQLIGSPWSPNGPVYNLVQDHFGQPTEHVVVLRSNGPQNNPKYFTPERCQDLEDTDPVAHQTSVLALFADPESGLLSPIAVRQSRRETGLELPPSDDMLYFGSIDPSEGKAGGNGFALCIIGVTRDRSNDEPQRYVVSYIREWRGLNLRQILREIAAICRRYRLPSVRTDSHAKGALTGLAQEAAGLKLVFQRTKTEDDWEWVRQQIHGGYVELPPDRQLSADLLGIKKRITQAGANIVLPQTSDGRHADMAAAFCGAMIAAGRGRGNRLGGGRSLLRVLSEQTPDEREQMRARFAQSFLHVDGMGVVPAWVAAVFRR